MNPRINFQCLNRCNDHIRNTENNNKKILIVGNGGSAVFAGHVLGDFTKLAKIRATNLNEADLITCLASDYGYESWVAKGLRI